MKERQAGDIWQGMYDFPLLETQKENDEEKVLAYLKNRSIRPITILLSQSKKHILSHQIIQANFWEIDLNEHLEMDSARFFSKSEIEVLPKPKLIVNYLHKKIN
jgi:A/G-specific adenine glycosylase